MPMFFEGFELDDYASSYKPQVEVEVEIDDLLSALSVIREQEHADLLLECLYKFI